MSDVSAEEILTRIDGSVGVVTLNRPRVINALTHTMVTALHSVLSDWADDRRVSAVILGGEGDRGMCAGGDVVAIYHSARTDGQAARQFWFDEYRLNAYIAAYPKPLVTLMSGLVMGGGIGVGAHANTRVVTDTSRLAMPEVGIGLVPDVGGTFLLSRAPRSAGLHLGLTGAPFDGADAIALGFADHFIRQVDIAAFTATMVESGAEAALSAHSVAPPPSTLARQEWVAECYDTGTASEIVAALRRRGGAAAQAADLIETRSPISVAVTLDAVRRAATLPTLEDVLVQEYRASCAAAASHDLVEGIRAQIIDKDRNPRWSPATLAEVMPADVAAYFEPVEPDLTFPTPVSSNAL